jgi:integrase
VLRKVEDPRDRALFWLIYDGGLRGLEALAIDIDDISWSERSILIHDKGDRPREMFFSRAVGTLLDKYLATRGYSTAGALFVTHRKARLPRRADLPPTATHASRTAKPIRSGKGIPLTGISTNCFSWRSRWYPAKQHATDAPLLASRLLSFCHEESVYNTGFVRKPRHACGLIARGTNRWERKGDKTATEEDFSEAMHNCKAGSISQEAF